MWHGPGGEGKPLFRLESAEAELDEFWLRLEHFCELDIASDRSAKGLELGAEPGENPCEAVVVVVWRELDAEVANRREVFEDFIEEAKKIRYDPVLRPIDA